MHHLDLNLDTLVDYDEEMLDILAKPWLADMHCAVEPDSDEEATFLEEMANQHDASRVNWNKEGF